MIIQNWVVTEYESVTIDVEGQGLPGPGKSESDKLAYIEMYFDHTEWAERFFTTVRETIERLCWSDAISYGQLYHIEERCGIDRR